MNWLIFLWLTFYFFLVLFFRLLIHRKSSIFFIVDANNVSIRKFAEKKKFKKFCRRAIWKKQSTRSVSWKTVWNHFRCLQAQCEQSAKFGKLERQQKKKKNVLRELRKLLLRRALSLRIFFITQSEVTRNISQSFHEINHKWHINEEDMVEDLCTKWRTMDSKCSRKAEFSFDKFLKNFIRS